MAIYCIACNYREKKPTDIFENNKPILFSKPDSSLSFDSVFHYPRFSTSVFYELEVVLKLSRSLQRASVKEAQSAFDQISLGIDWTARDLQSDAKANGLPWFLSKGFDEAAFISKWRHIEEYANLQDLNLSLRVDGIEKISGNTSQMMHSFGDILSYLSHYLTLKPNDIIFTGSPSKPDAIKVGQECKGYLNGEQQFSLTVVNSPI